MKLDEFEISNAGAGPVGERDAVASRHFRIRRFAEDLPCAAGCQQRGTSADFVATGIPVEISDAVGAAVMNEHLSHERVIDRHHRRQCANLFPQHPPNLAPGGVAGVQHAAHAVRRFAPQRKGASVVSLEPGPPRDQFADTLRAVLDQHAHGILVAQAVAGANRVGGVQRRAVVRSDRGCDTALCVARVAFRWFGLGEDKNVAGSGESHSGTQSGNAAADDHEIERVTHRMLS